MPTLLLINGYRFFFYSNENNEPIHIHFVKGNCVGKIWLVPNIQVAYLVGFSSKEEKLIVEIITENEVVFKTKWDEYFNN